MLCVEINSRKCDSDKNERCALETVLATAAFPSADDALRPRKSFPVFEFPPGSQR
jgi:hypothetical protein